MIGKKFPNFTTFMIFVLMLQLNRCMFFLYYKKDVWAAALPEMPEMEKAC